MGQPVRAVYKDRLESAVPRRLSICPCSATRIVLVLFADERCGIFRVAQGAVIYTLSCAGKSALRDSHGFGRKSNNRQASVSACSRRREEAETLAKRGSLAKFPPPHVGGYEF